MESRSVVGCVGCLTLTCLGLGAGRAGWKLGGGLGVRNFSWRHNFSSIFLPCSRRTKYNKPAK